MKNRASVRTQKKAAPGEIKAHSVARAHNLLSQPPAKIAAAAGCRGLLRT